MKNVVCTLVPNTNTVFVWDGNPEVDGGASMVAMVTEGEGGEPLMTVYGNRDGMRALTFNDLEIIQDNWNQLQELRGWEHRRQQIYKKGENVVDGDGGL